MKKSITAHTNETELTHSMAHYLLTIHKLKEKKGYARVTDIAKDMGLTKGSVSIALNNLKKRELVLEDEGRFLSLSSLGHDQVHQILSSRTLLFYFLRDFVGVGQEQAHQDSCLMEHLISNETREKFFVFMKKLACECDSKIHTQLNIKSTLDLCQFDDAKAFSEVQEGDSYLGEEPSKKQMSHG